MRVFAKPTGVEVDAAVRASSEHSSEPTVRHRAHDWPVSGRHCASCGVFEDDCGPDPSEELRRCRDCEECYCHTFCLADGLCPHCRVIASDLADARALLGACGDLSIEMALGQIAAADRRARGIAE